MSSINGDDLDWPGRGFGVLGAATAEYYGRVADSRYGVWGLLGTQNDNKNIFQSELSGRGDTPLQQAAILGRNSLPEDDSWVYAIYGEFRQINSSAKASGFIAGRDPKFQQHAGVYGESDRHGVIGLTTDFKGTGVYGGGTASTGDHIGVLGETLTGVGVVGRSSLGRGVSGESVEGHGVHGQNGEGSGLAPNVGTGVYGESDNGFGVYASSRTNVGVYAESQTTNGLLGVTHSSSVAAVSGVNKSGGIGVYGEGRIAGFFAGDVEVTGDVILTNGGDIAEIFEAESGAVCEPGAVMIMGENGALVPCCGEYDKRVIGVISGAGTLRPAITLVAGKRDVPTAQIALIGTVYCRVDADAIPIETGDLLTTSAVSGHATKATDPIRSFGAIIGKALAPLANGSGLIPILLTRQ